jgi:hypothetical protein
MLVYSLLINTRMTRPSLKSATVSSLFPVNPNQKAQANKTAPPFSKKLCYHDIVWRLPRLTNSRKYAFSCR